MKITKTTTTVEISGRRIDLKTEMTYRDETSREVRATNAATFLLENWDTLSELGANITCRKVRNLFIQCLGGTLRDSEGELLGSLLRDNAPTEDVRGDLRAHGDALGLHCLKLPMKSKNAAGGRKEKVLALNTATQQILQKFLLPKRKVDLID